jgi:hypothetical protein
MSLEISRKTFNNLQTSEHGRILEFFDNPTLDCIWYILTLLPEDFVIIIDRNNEYNSNTNQSVHINLPKLIIDFRIAKINGFYILINGDKIINLPIYTHDIKPTFYNFLADLFWRGIEDSDKIKELIRSGDIELAEMLWEPMFKEWCEKMEKEEVKMKSNPTPESYYSNHYNHNWK